jgi:protein associated with RNAse G/E
MDRLVHVDFRKWPDRVHWQFSMRRLGEDEHGLWLWAPPGMPFRRGDERAKVSDRIVVKLIVEDAWWTAIWNDGGRNEFYVDIVTPAKWEGDRVTMVDLDLDVVRRIGGEVEVLDEDEFLDHQVRYHYPERLVDQARAATAQVAIAVQRNDEPFRSAGLSWMERARDLARLSS